MTTQEPEPWTPRGHRAECRDDDAGSHQLRQDSRSRAHRLHAPSMSGPSMRSWRATYGPPMEPEPWQKPPEKHPVYCYVLATAGVLGAILLTAVAAAWLMRIPTTASLRAGSHVLIGSEAPRDELGTSHSFWSTKPSSPQEHAVAAGARLIFRYTAAHNVWLMPSQAAWDACDFSAAQELAATDHGGVAPADADRLGYANEYHFRARYEYGTHQYYFACQVSDHCVKGQKIAVTVR